MTPTEARDLLQQFKEGRLSEEQALQAFQAAPFTDLQFAQVDTHRALRKGFPEVIFGAGKTPDQVVAIAQAILAREKQLLITRVTEEHFAAINPVLPQAQHHPRARIITVELEPLPRNHGKICVLSAGTSDLPVAEEAAITAEIMGNVVERIYDVGVAGLHRLLRRYDQINTANVIIAVAGMEGAMPSVVAGLVRKPVIAVPTSIGYGANFGGLAALLGMLTSCGSGVTVVNIDNGFGAGYAASQINTLANEQRLK
ncbi:MAG: nickel pincer cofactor biosynthesis protein LarB [Verrucomicrobiales bacterium]